MYGVLTVKRVPVVPRSGPRPASPVSPPRGRVANATAAKPKPLWRTSGTSARPVRSHALIVSDRNLGGASSGAAAALRVAILCCQDRSKGNSRSTAFAKLSWRRVFWRAPPRLRVKTRPFPSTPIRPPPHCVVLRRLICASARGRLP